MLLHNTIRKIALFFFFLHSFFTITAQYVPDILGDPFATRTIRMPDDYEGAVVCTLVKHKNIPSPKAVLYIHGYNDYFFQKEMAEKFIRHGYDFYAVDLRKYGRSILPHQIRFFVKDIREYFPDIDTTLAIIRNEGHSEIILAAHSTGGLIASLYMNDRKEACSALILNSPFFDWYLTPWEEKMIIPIISWWGKSHPKAIATKVSKSQYGASLHSGEHGEWNYCLQMKRDGNDTRAGWIRAIHLAQKELHRGLSIDVPILVMRSGSSMREGKKWNEDYHRHDIVLDTEDIRKYAEVIGSDVTEKSVAGGKHDLILSLKDVREEVYRIIFEWLEEQNL